MSTSRMTVNSGNGRPDLDRGNALLNSIDRDTEPELDSHELFGVFRGNDGDAEDSIADGQCIDPDTKHRLESATSHRQRRPVINVTPDEHVVVEAAINALSRDDNLYQRAGELVHIVRQPTDSEEKGVERFAGTPRIKPIAKAHLQELLSEHCRFTKLIGKGDKVKAQHVHPPKFCVEAIHSRGFWPESIRYLSGIVEVPVLRPDGTILDTPGWDEATGLVYEPIGAVPRIARNPKWEDVQRCAMALDDIIDEFPFAKAEHRSTWFAGLLTVLSRRAFSGPAPLFLLDANVRGSGKSLLTDVIAIIATGRDMPRMSNPGNDDEARKRITAIALAGDPLVLIDNIAGTLGTPSLDVVLTSTVWEDRLLKTNEMIKEPMRTTWFATGNNVILLGDTSRRVCHARLESDLENPEEREGFKYPRLLQHVHEHRVDLLGAALTILRAYIVAGRPDMGLRPWGSYDGWSDLVRNAVVWCGMGDPGETRRELAEQCDQDASALRALTAGWHEVDPKEEGLTTAKLAQMLNGDREKFDTVRSALEELKCSEKGNIISRKIGYALRRFKGRVVDGRRITSDDARSGVKRWCITTIATTNGGESSESGGDGGHGGDAFFTTRTSN